MTLDNINLGDLVSIAKINTSHINIKRKLLSMGFTPGACVKVLAKSPLGGPLQVIIRGYLIAIRKSEASNIEVAPA